MRTAIMILDQHRPQLDELAATLLAREVMEREDIRRVMHGVQAAIPARGSSSRIGLAAATAVNPARLPHSPGD